jgi:hypothetical protein
MYVVEQPPWWEHFPKIVVSLVWGALCNPEMSLEVLVLHYMKLKSNFTNLFIMRDRYVQVIPYRAELKHLSRLFFSGANIYRNTETKIISDYFSGSQSFSNPYVSSREIFCDTWKAMMGENKFNF